MLAASANTRRRRAPNLVLNLGLSRIQGLWICLALKWQNNRPWTMRIPFAVVISCTFGETEMNKIASPRHSLPGLAIVLIATLAIAGCHNQSAHPDEKSAVTNSLNSS